MFQSLKERTWTNA